MPKNQPVAAEPAAPPPTELEQIRMTTNEIQNQVTHPSDSIIKTPSKQNAKNCLIDPFTPTTRSII